DESCGDLTTKVLDAANVLDDGELTTENVHLTRVVKEEDLPQLGEDFESFMSVPLITEGRVIGILTTANTKENAFQPDDVKLLYQLGLQSAETFDRIGR
ncbi:MAG: GAF domain-containing protein, partial [Actinomycetia bacterium]|nr:GAF domain-containing protein [Actinomycetes bacterium]